MNVCNGLVGRKGYYGGKEIKQYEANSIQSGMWGVCDFLKEK